MIKYDFLIQDKKVLENNKILEILYKMLNELEVLAYINKDLAMGRCRYIIEFLYENYIRIYGEKSIKYTKLKQDKKINLKGYKKDYGVKTSKVLASIEVIDKETEKMLDELYNIIRWLYSKISNSSTEIQYVEENITDKTILDYNIIFNDDNCLQELSLKDIKHKRLGLDKYNFTIYDGNVIIYDKDKNIIFEAVVINIDKNKKEDILGEINASIEDIKVEYDRLYPYVEALEESVLRIQDKNVTMVKELTEYANSFAIEEDRRKVLLSALNKLKREENKILNRVSDSLDNINSNIEVFIDSFLGLENICDILILSNYLDKAMLTLNYLKVLHIVLKKADIYSERIWLWEKIHKIIDNAKNSEFTERNYKQLYTLNEVKCFFNIYKMQYLEMSFQYQCERMFSDYYVNSNKKTELENQKLSEQALITEKTTIYNNNLLEIYKNRCKILQTVGIGFVIVMLFLVIVNYL